MNVLRNVMVQHRTDGSAPFPHQSFTASVEESIAYARLTFPPSIWNIEENIFDQIFDRVADNAAVIIESSLRRIKCLTRPTEPEPTETVSYQTSLF